MFSQIPPEVYVQLLEIIPSDHVYNGKTEQLVIWGKAAYDQQLITKIGIIVGQAE